MSVFSIIIPLYNKETFIVDTLNSVLHQTFTDFEVLVINDGSTDKSEELVLKFEDSRIKYFSKENEGVAKARNFGIENSKSDFICFLDADDYWHPNFLEEFYKTIETYPDYTVFSCAIEIEGVGKILPAHYSVIKKENIQIVNYFEASLKRSILWTSGVVIHKSVFNKVGKFDSSIQFGEDTDLWIRIGLEYPVVFNWYILSRYVYDQNSISRSKYYIYDSKHINKFAEQEKNNTSLQTFLDLNRFSAAIKYKLIGDTVNFRKMSAEIHFKNLSLKKIILLKLPSSLLEKLVKLESFLVKIGLANSVFK